MIKLLHGKFQMAVPYQQILTINLYIQSHAHLQTKNYLLYQED